LVDILNLALPYFGLIFIGFACGKAKGLPEQGLAWMNFFLLYVSLPALLFGIMSKTPFTELNNPPFLIATTLGTMTALVLALLAGRIVGQLSLREATLAGLAGAYGNIGYNDQPIEIIRARWKGAISKDVFALCFNRTGPNQ
jgi:malonate transporter